MKIAKCPHFLHFCVIFSKINFVHAFCLALALISTDLTTLIINILKLFSEHEAVSLSHQNHKIYFQGMLGVWGFLDLEIRHNFKQNHIFCVWKDSLVNINLNNFREGVSDIITLDQKTVCTCGHYFTKFKIHKT